MPRFSGSHIQLGGAFQLTVQEEDHQETVNNLVQEAELRAKSIVEKAKAQARQLLEAANQKAGQLEAEAEAKKEEVLRLAYQEGEEAGYAKGYEEGYAQAEQETVRLLEGAQTVMEGAYISKQRVLKGFRESAASIITHITTKILNHALNLDPGLLIEMVNEAIQSLHLTGRVKVVVSAETLETIKQFTPKTEDALSRLSRFEFVSDPQLSLSEIFIISQDGNFNLTPATQVETLIRPLVKDLPINEVIEDDDEGEEDEEASFLLPAADVFSETLPAEPSLPESWIPEADPPVFSDVTLPEANAMAADPQMSELPAEADAS